MTSSKNNRIFLSSKKNKEHLIKVFLVLCITIWLAYFWHVNSFGLYSDDLPRIGNAISWSWSDFFNLMPDSLGEQGRPLHDGLIHALSFLGFKIGGLNAIYIVGFTILAVNSILFYIFLNHLLKDSAFAFTGSLAFCLFPAHTTQIWLTILFGAQPSLTFLLIAYLLYLSERKKLSYLAILGSLLCYETYFPVFLAAPLIRKKWNYKLAREVISHALILAGILLSVAIIRKLGGESRLESLSLAATVRTSTLHMIAGPFIALKMFFIRPIHTLEALNRRTLGFSILYFAMLAWVLSGLKLSYAEKEFRLVNMINSKILHVRTSNFYKNLFKVLFLGLIMLCLAYSLTLIGGVGQVNSVGSRIHLAAVVGASIIVACVCSGILFLGKIYGNKNLAILSLAAFFSLLLGFGFSIQRDYILSWQYQQKFFSDVIKLAPDLSDGVVILFEPESLLEPKYITAFKVPTMRSAFEDLYKLPSDWEFPPIISPLREDWKKHILLDNNTISLNKDTIFTCCYERTVEGSNIIFLEVKNGNLTRRTEPILIDGEYLRLKDESFPIVPNLERKPIYEYLIGNSDKVDTSYIKSP